MRKGNREFSIVVLELPFTKRRDPPAGCGHWLAKEADRMPHNFVGLSQFGPACLDFGWGRDNRQSPAVLKEVGLEFGSTVNDEAEKQVGTGSGMRKMVPGTILQRRRVRRVGWLWP